ncbi:mechanosensitive ion channel family protein [uncultured Roseobacter sp.]|uniref:mechanosensitive ion channel family protein n=1 Tax=uncultured Roseobacter sp. TaxID=114847 RepID=UPI0026022CD7|nr:mechanosensitive ion channel family protein [uncultured Roseobacter sp.]
MTLSLAATAQTVDVPPAEEPATVPESEVAIEPTARDSEIETRITRILQATGWFDALRVTADEGIVFLNGITTSEAHRTWARDLAAKTAGTVAVVNNISVESRVDWSLEPALNELEKLAEETLAVLPLILLALLVLPLAWYASRLVARLAVLVLTRSIHSPFLRQVTARAISFPVFLLGLYIVLQVAGLTQLALSVVGGAGVLGIIIGFAFRDIAENFLASLILSVRRPFQRGDFIEVAGISGTVKAMNSRSTLITSIEGNEIHVPNSTIFKNVIENFTSSPNRRGDFLVGIGYDAQVATAQTVIMDCLQNHPAVLAEPEPMVLVDALGASTVNIRTYFWFDGHRISPIKLKSALLRAVKTALLNEGISMPDEAREVIFPEGVRVIGPGSESVTPAEEVTPSQPAAPEPQVTEGEGDLLTETPEDSGPAEEDDLLGPATP